MKTLILDGSQPGDRVGVSIYAALAAELTAQGAEVEHVRIADKQIAPCMGDFFCWIRTPGVCNLDDDNRDIARSFVHAELVIYLTPVTFGGYGSTLKSAVDHVLQTISPFFVYVNGEIHHKQRYPRHPRFLALGWLPQPDPVSEGIFHHLAYRNGINMHAANAASGVVYASQPPDEIREAVNGWLKEVSGPKSKVRPELPQIGAYEAIDFAAPERALLLIGSPRGKTSSSQMLGGYLFERLAERGVQTDSIRLQTVLRSEDKQRAMVRSVAEADLVVLAAPLYIDSLPAQTIRMLEMIAAHRKSMAGMRPQRFVAIVNCGFPEANHNRTALAICEAFARQAGFEWAGGLSLGAGEGMVHGTPLEEGGGQTMVIRQSLSLAAEALAIGKPVPPEAIALMAKPVIPAWLYRIIGGFGWREQAKKWGAQKQLDAQPYA